MFEPILQFFFCFEVVTLLLELLDLVEYCLCNLIRLAHLE